MTKSTALRIRVSLLSLLLPWVMIVAVLLVPTLLPPSLHRDYGAVIIVLYIATLIAAMVIRVYYAGLYVRDKNRRIEWRSIALLGIWGWVVLWLLPDRSSLEPSAAERLSQSSQGQRPS